MSKKYKRFWYYNTKTQDFECLYQPTRARIYHKILITPARLKKNVIADVGPDDFLTGTYVSLIEGVEFYWTDLNAALIDPEHDYRVYHPETMWTAFFMDERGW